MTESAFAGPVDTLEVYSASMQKNIPCIVMLPSRYSVTDGPYPVLYLLHGWSGNHTGWISEAPHLLEQCDRYQMIIVCPDGGYGSWYLDSPVDTTVRYETHIAQELVKYIDYQYNTIASPAGRAISGISMGGHGALYLGLRHPDVFGAAGSMCGGLDLRPFRKNDWELERILGKPSSHWENWENNSVVNMVDKAAAASIPLYIDCGLGDFFLETNREMHHRLLNAKVLHTYTERPGEHNQEYWTSAVDDQVLFFYKFFSRIKDH